MLLQTVAGGLHSIMLRVLLIKKNRHKKSPEEDFRAL